MTLSEILTIIPERSRSCSSGLLNMPRRQFLDLLGAYGVSPIDETQDVAAEALLAAGVSHLKYKPAD